MGWKIIFVVLIIFLLGTAFLVYKQETSTYKFGDIEIKKAQLDNINNEVGDRFTLCDIEKNKCIKIGKIG